MIHYARRREQEEEGKIADRMRDQRAATSTASNRFIAAQRYLRDLSTRSSTGSPMELVQRLEAEVRDNRTRARDDIPKQIIIRKERLQKLQATLMEPTKSEADLDQLKAEVY